MTPSPEAAPISAIIPAWRRIDSLLDSLAKISACAPPPAEILVHIDHGERPTQDAVHAAFPDVHILLSEDHVGPGGGRNVMIEAATQPLLASFDDDSYPLTEDYFAQSVALAARYPNAAIFAAHISESLDESPASENPCRVADFTACGCIFRRDSIRGLPGFLPLPVAYGAEEVDLALQVIDAGHDLVFAPDLRVQHCPDAARHHSPELVAGAMRNQLLLTACRYPVSAWPRGFAQCLRRFAFFARLGKARAALSGLASFPSAWRAHRSRRNPVSPNAIRRHGQLRRHPEPLN